MIKLRESNFCDIVWAFSPARQDKIWIYAGKKDHWFQIFLDEKLVGVACFTKFRPAAWRLKVIFILRSERGVGYGTDALNQLIEIAKQSGVRRLEAVTKDPRWLERKGWLKQTETQNRWKMHLIL